MESQLREPDAHRSYLLYDPIETIQCTEPDALNHCLDRIDEELDRGNFVAGFISYEAGLALNPHQSPRSTDGFPLLWMGIYEKALMTDAPLLIAGPSERLSAVDPELDTGRDEFIHSVERILRLIREGDTYQVNLTARLNFHFSGSPLDMYLGLRRSHPVPFGALMNCGSFSVISQSPELFLSKTGNIIETRPMKGTAPRGADIQTDRKNEKVLEKSEKNRAENLMIGDLMRNDLGRIAVPGSVEVFDPFRIERYRSVFQMTTGIRCRVPNELTVKQVVTNTFPPGSITGAPKVRTMQIIADLEKSPRKVYTGAMGLFLPDRDFVLSVAIRTIIMNSDGSCELGIGSGIVADSSPEEEYRETVLKSEFLRSEENEPVRLLETILVNEKGQMEFLSQHLDRMKRSSAVLGFPFSPHHAREELERHLRPAPEGPVVARLLLDARGDYQVQVMALEDLAVDCDTQVRISPNRTDKADDLLRHKTTDRALYDNELERTRSDGFIEVLFENTDGYITEGAFTNIFLLMPDGWKTPPVTCGLLPGIWRELFIAENSAAEIPLTRRDLSAASRVIVGNSVRGAIEVDRIVDSEDCVVFRRING